MTPAKNITFDFHEGIITLTFNHPTRSVNVLDRATLKELERHMASIHWMLDHDWNGQGVLVHSTKPGVFIAGADINELQAVTDPQEVRTLVTRAHKLFNDIEKLPVPVIALINGVCLGGGLELALACHYRIAANDSRVQMGLPEVNLGIIPGFGGTQRLPRLMGLAVATEAITTGRLYSAQDAKRLGIVDELVPPDLLLSSAKERLEYGLPPFTIRTSKHNARKTKLERFPFGPHIIAWQARKKAFAKTHGNYPAIPAAIEAIRQSASDFERGLAYEAAAISRLATNPVAKHLMRLFFLDEQTKTQVTAAPKPVRSVTVLGAGTMGSGIAYVCANAGIRTILWDGAPKEPEKALANALGKIKKLFDFQVTRQWLSRDEAERRFRLITPTLDLATAAHADLVIEAIVENLSLKQQVFSAVARVNPRAILASNTSSLKISELGEGIVGMHFFNPPYSLPLVEIVRGKTTRNETLATAVSFALRIGKKPIVVEDQSGFVVNRVLMPDLVESLELLNQGVSIKAIDAAMLKFGMPMGPFRLLDEIGFDVAHAVVENLTQTFGARMRPALALKPLIEAGFHGKVNKKGFWFPGEKKVNQEILALLPFKNPYGSCHMDQSEIVDRIVLPMINELALCLQEKVITDAGLADYAVILGTGFPAFRGGPLAYADTIGIANVVARMNALAVQAPSKTLRFTPCALLNDMARTGTHFRTDLI